ncbi:unnamed protein product [Menidia menidia]|uniref:(Atlantic silverside) hypothetical protein n=1 Tax=Menidia menidia TaxID=238744 RepID=A0A8S4AV09_9TELE|nr:unnamed protein product [Menidia menidia]
MSNTPTQDPVVQGLSSDSGQTLPSRPLQSIPEPSTSKRVCFYRSGDYTFNGHRMIITARTFKTFDALLDALSKKVPLPFGVRTITTPRGTHFIKALDDLQDGGAYVCSDQKRVKPLNLEEVNRRQVPWNTTRPLSVGRRRRQGLRLGQLGKGKNIANRPAKVTERVAVKTPKKLVVIKNRDPSVKRTVVLQRRIAPTFDALLDYLSQILQFPVLKLYSTDGRRVDGLSGLILCSGVVVAAGNEPFKLGNYSFHTAGQNAQIMYIENVEPPTLPSRSKGNKSFSSGRGSRNFSLSSERYIVNQIAKSQNGNMSDHLHDHNGSFETEASQHHAPMEACGTRGADDQRQTSIVPHDDDIEKSFRINQDGSMTVEMKVHLTIKEEEMLQWTTTLSRSSLNKRTVCASVSGSGNSSPDSNNAVAKDSPTIKEDERKEENYHDGAGKGLGFDEERLYEGYSSTASGKAKTSLKRTPTPGPRHVKKKTSVESVKMITETGVQESTLGHYSYMERTADGDTTEGYCVVRHSSSSNRPIPKPRKIASAGANNNNRSSLRSSGVAEVLQIQNDGMEVTETVMHIYESQGCFDNYVANDEYSVEGKKTISKPKSMIEYSLSPPKKSLELSESGSMPSLNPTPSEIHQYVESWLEKVSPDQVPHIEEEIVDGAETRTKVIFKLGDDSESDEVNECQSHSNETMKKSSSCLSVPLYREGPPSALLPIDHISRGLCVSMPSVRSDPVHQEDTLRLHKSAEAIGPTDSEISTPNVLNPKAKIKPVLRQLCSSIQCIRRASTSNTASTLQNSNSVPNFSTQVTSVFGSSCKALLSFLSVMTLRDNLKGSGEGNQSASTSEAMLMMESIQKISTIEDEEDQRASLTDLQSRASSQLRERWNDFRILRERLESEPLSPRVSETEFALDVMSEGGDVFENQDLQLNELMDELNMPQDLREEITSTIQQVKSFYPVEESTYVENVINQSETEDEVEQFVKDCTDDTKELDNTLEDITEATQANEDPKDGEELQTESSDPSKVEENTVERAEDKEPEYIADLEADDENDYQEQVNEKDYEEGVIEEEENNEEEGDGEEDKESDTESIEKVLEGTEGEMTGDEEEVGERLDTLEKEESEGKAERSVGEETGEDNSGEDTDERQGAEDTEEDNKSVEVETEEKEDENEELAEAEMTQIEEGEEDPEDAEEDVKHGIEENAGIIDEDAEEGQEEEEEQEEEETDQITEKDVEEEVIEEKTVESETDVDEKEEEKEQFVGTVGEENGGEENSEKQEEREKEDSYTDEDGEEENCDVVGESRRALEKTVCCLKEESEEEKEVIDELEVEENMSVEQIGDDEEEEEDVDEENMSDEGLKQVEAHSTDEMGNASEDANSSADDEDCKSVEEAPCFQQPGCRSDEEKSKHSTESPTKYSSEGQCEDDKGSESAQGTDEGGEECEGSSNSSSHPVEISQELLDFVNDALQSCALIFTYDTQGKVRIEPENARVVQTKQNMMPKGRKDSSYGLKCLPSPITSDLSDYRPETSESGGYKTQESLEIASESGEEVLGRHFPAHPHSAMIERSNLEPEGSKLSEANSSDALHNSCDRSFSSTDTGIKDSREDLSHLSTASSLKAVAEPDTHNVQSISFTSDKDSGDGVLIDRGRWLLKENHLIRKSPPVAVGMYGDVDSTSMDTGQENTSEDTPPHSKIQHSPLVAISSSELEDMAKPLTPKCTYYNMPHGSDSDPFFDDSSIRSGKHDLISVKGRGVRVSPVVDTSKTWANRNGSMSSFASVEFKIPDRKVHPECQTSAVTQEGRTSGGEQVALQAQDSLDSLQLRCSQYCPIL